MLFQTEPSRVKDARELVLASVVHCNRFLEAINESLRVRQQQDLSGQDRAELESIPPAVPCSKLTYIAAPLMKCLTQLLVCENSGETIFLSDFYFLFSNQSNKRKMI